MADTAPRERPAAKAYLRAYNAVQAVGWAVCLIQVLRTAGQGPEAAYRAGAPAAGGFAHAHARGWRAPPLRGPA